MIAGLNVSDCFGYWLTRVILDSMAVKAVVTVMNWPVASTIKNDDLPLKGGHTQSHVTIFFNFGTPP